MNVGGRLPRTPNAALLLQALEVRSVTDGSVGSTNAT
jgi:hypothetical protein